MHLITEPAAAAAGLINSPASTAHDHDFHYYLEDGRTVGQCRHCRYRKVVSEKRVPDMRTRPLQRDED